MLSRCFHFDFKDSGNYVEPVKTIPLTIRKCPPEVHQALKKAAAANNRSLNGETLTWLQKQAKQQKACTGKQLAAALRRADALLNDDDRRQIAKGIEKAIRFGRTAR